MSRLVEGIKELWKGKDDDEKEYRYRYDQRQSPGSNRYYGDPANASAEARRYPSEGRGGYPANSIDSRSGYPVNATADGRSGYPADGRSGYPAEGRSGYPADGRSGYPAEGRSGYPTDGRSGYPVEGRSGYPAEGRSGYPVEGRSGYPAEGRSGYPTEGRSGYPVEGRSGYPANSIPDARSGYPVTPTVDGRSGYPANSIPEPRSSYPANGTAGGYRKPFGQALDDDYIRSSYDTRTESRGEYRKPYGISDSSPRGSEYRQPYGISESSPRRPAEVSPRVGEYVRTSQASPREYRKSSGGSVIELMVPMCCDKCKEKVQEELSEVDGVETVRCDPKNSRVIVTGDKFIDIDRCLTKAERAVKKKCELISNRADDSSSNRPEKTTPSGYYEAVERSGILAPPTVSRPSPGPGSKLVRMPSFASGKMTQYDGVGPRGQDYEPKDYTGFRRMPSLGKHKYNDAEYITSFDQRPEPSDQRSFAPIRRMPSLGRHRNHDAEYTTDDRVYNPRTFYESGSSYTSAYNDRPSLSSQVSFSKIPVENPNYVKHIGNY